MASTAQERISLMDQALYNDPENKDLLKQIIRLKLADGVKYKTVEDYLMEDYHDNIEFNAEKLKPLLVERANQTKKNYLAGLEELIANKFNDPQYSEQLPYIIDENGKIVTRSFIDFLKDKKIGQINLENGTVKHGDDIISVEEFYNVFKDKNVLNVKVTVQNMVSDIIEELSTVNSYDDEAIYRNTQLRNILFEDLVNDIIENQTPIKYDVISVKVGEVLTKNIQDVNDMSELQKLEQDIPDNTESKTDEIRNSGPEDDDGTVIEAGDGTEETEVFLNEKKDPVGDVPEIGQDQYGTLPINSKQVDNEKLNTNQTIALLSGLGFDDQKKMEEFINSVSVSEGINKDTEEVVAGQARAR